MTVTTPRILVVSESRITRRVVEMSFADQKVELVSAASGAEGLAAWEQQPASVIVADLTMDAPDGLGIAHHVLDRAGDRAPAMILMAGANEAVDDTAMAGAGVRVVLRKPLDSLQLVEAVRAATRTARPAPAATSPRADADRMPVPPSAAEPAEAPAVPPVEPPPPDHGSAFQGEASAAPWPPAPMADVVARDAAAEPVPFDLADEALERVAARVAAIWSGDAGREERVAALVAERAGRAAASEMERVAPAAASEAAERLVRELAPKLVAEVARLVVADVSERLVREEIARMRAEHQAR